MVNLNWALVIFLQWVGKTQVEVTENKEKCREGVREKRESFLTLLPVSGRLAQAAAPLTVVLCSYLPQPGLPGLYITQVVHATLNMLMIWYRPDSSATSPRVKYTSDSFSLYSSLSSLKFKWQATEACVIIHASVGVAYFWQITLASSNTSQANFKSVSSSSPSSVAFPSTPSPSSPLSPPSCTPLVPTESCVPFTPVMAYVARRWLSITEDTCCILWTWGSVACWFESSSLDVESAGTLADILSE